MFYKALCAVENENEEEIAADRLARHKRAEGYHAAALAYSQKGKGIFFLSGIDREKATVAIQCERPATADDVFAFGAFLSLGMVDCCVSEIDFAAFCDLLSTAEENGFVAGDAEILELGGLNPLKSHGPWRRDYTETMLREMSREDLRGRAARCFLAEDVSEELDRIEGGAPPSAAGHPVHYAIMTDLPDEQTDVCDVLLASLYGAGRLAGKHCCHLKIVPGRNAPASFFQALYKSAVGGCVVVRFPASECARESDFADSDDEDGNVYLRLGEAIEAFRHRVLTVVCCPADGDRYVGALRAYAGSVLFVNVKERPVSGEKAVAFLHLLAARRDVWPDEQLTGAVRAGEAYSFTKLHRLFDDWFDQKIKRECFPQYASVYANGSVSAVPGRPAGDAFERLDRLVGLTEAKQTIRRIVACHKLQAMMKERGLPHARPSMHMVFTGSPGTAKTTVARLFAAVMKENGLLSTGSFSELGRSDLVGKYVGWTAKQVKEHFEKARGGVLFIDEIYSLVDDRRGLYGDEAINTIVQEMENHREDVAVIFAGYTDLTEAFLDRNPGLRSRIPFHVRFEDYSVEELLGIARLQAERLGLTFGGDVEAKLVPVFAEAKKEPSFGNGRFVRNLMEQAQMNLAERLSGSDADRLTAEAITTLRPEDVVFVGESSRKKSGRIGFRL